MRYSVVLPAHNEEHLLPRALRSVAAAGRYVDGDVEMVVVANRCSDATAVIARAAGAVVVENDVRNIAAVRNDGARVATGDILVTMDADCVMSIAALSEVDRLLGTGRYVGGGTRVVPERRSAGILATLAVVEVAMLLLGLGGGMFWCRRADFEAVGGFDESLFVGEDVDFARRLKAHGRRTGRRFTVQRRAPIAASTRKFDRFGDWHMFAMALQVREIRAAWHGRDTAWVDRYFFDFDD